MRRFNKATARSRHGPSREDRVDAEGARFMKISPSCSFNSTSIYGHDCIDEQKEVSGTQFRHALAESKGLKPTGHGPLPDPDGWTVKWSRSTEKRGQSLLILWPTKVRRKLRGTRRCATAVGRGTFHCLLPTYLIFLFLL